MAGHIAVQVWGCNWIPKMVKFPFIYHLCISMYHFYTIYITVLQSPCSSLPTPAKPRQRPLEVGRNENDHHDLPTEKNGHRWRRWRLHLFCWATLGQFGYGSIPIHTIFRGMNIHLQAILMFTGGTRFWHTWTIWHGTANFIKIRTQMQKLSQNGHFGIAPIRGFIMQVRGPDIFLSAKLGKFKTCNVNSSINSQFITRKHLSTESWGEETQCLMFNLCFWWLNQCFSAG